MNIKKSKQSMSNILRSQLKCFGLNPNNWTLTPFPSTSRFIIVNKKNKNFKLIGTPYLKNKRKPAWKDIQLMSL